MSQRFANLAAGRRTKWLFLAVWLAAFIALGPFAGSLSGEQRNDPQAYAPHSAESSQVRAELAELRRGSPLPAVVLYTRDTALTSQDRAAVDADRAQFADLAPGRVGEPVRSQDGRALSVTVALDGAKADAAYDATLRLHHICQLTTQ